MKSWLPGPPKPSRIAAIADKIRTQDAVPLAVAQFTSTKEPKDSLLKIHRPSNRPGRAIFKRAIIDTETREEWPDSKTCAAALGIPEQRRRIVIVCAGNRYGKANKVAGRLLRYRSDFLNMETQ